ncbi:MAG: class I SAM-dependent methyltransferase [Nocardioidaceae bacterium]
MVAATSARDGRRDGKPGTSSVASLLGGLVGRLVGGELPLRLEFWDGSGLGPSGAHRVLVRSPVALRRLLRHPGELGLAQVYVTNEIEVEGDLIDGLRTVWSAARDGNVRLRRVTPSLVLEAARVAHRLGALGLPPDPPMSQARLRGHLHSVRRDRAAIAHHYDLSNDFYALLLDPELAYSCAYWTSWAASYGLREAQRDKLDLVCRKLELKPGMRLLDIGCGWGSISLYAAEHHGVEVVGVTLSEQQRSFVSARIGERRLGDRVEVRLMDYRDVRDGPYDAITSLEMGEHVGSANYPTFAARIHDLLAAQGRALIQQMSRRTRPGGGPFIEAFIAPDMHMRPVGETVALIEDAGLEVRDVHALREHYVRTVHAWYATFEDNWDKAVELVGEEVARVWRLYLVGGALAFEEGRMGVDQILAVRPARNGESGMPAQRVR